MKYSVEQVSGQVSTAEPDGRGAQDRDGYVRFKVTWSTPDGTVSKLFTCSPIPESAVLADGWTVPLDVSRPCHQVAVCEPRAPESGTAVNQLGEEIRQDSTAVSPVAIQSVCFGMVKALTRGSLRVRLAYQDSSKIMLVLALISS
jgi:hypothetical protein